MRASGARQCGRDATGAVCDAWAAAAAYDVGTACAAGVRGVRAVGAVGAVVADDDAAAAGAAYDAGTTTVPRLRSPSG